MSPPLKDDEQNWIEKAKNGDSQAFQWLYETYQRRIFVVCFAKVSHQEDALDCVQEAFIKAFRSLSNFRGDSKFYSWLYRIAINCCMDFLRKKKREGKKEPLFEEQDNPMEDQKPKGVILKSSDSPAKNVIHQELGETIESAINSLSKEHKEVLLLREVEQMSYDEIAIMLNVQKGTIMSRLFYARKVLQQKLKG